MYFLSFYTKRAKRRRIPIFHVNLRASLRTENTRTIVTTCIAGKNVQADIDRRELAARPMPDQNTVDGIWKSVKMSGNLFQEDG